MEFLDSVEFFTYSTLSKFRVMCAYHRQHHCETEQRNNRHLRNNGGKGAPAQQPSAAARNIHKRWPKREREKYRHTAGAKKYIFRSIRARGTKVRYISEMKAKLIQIQFICLQSANATGY